MINVTIEHKHLKLLLISNLIPHKTSTRNIVKHLQIDFKCLQIFSMYNDTSVLIYQMMTNVQIKK